jgi:putative membrane-bound dehydrogenase-like protein
MFAVALLTNSLWAKDADDFDLDELEEPAAAVAKPKLGKSETGKPEAAKPEAGKPKAPKSEPVKADPVKPASANVDAGEDLGLTVPEGFTVTRFADDTLAHDIFAMTIDTQGRVVVSGPGYVKILVDSDNDGVADRAIQFADGPKSGAQGLYFYGRNLLCTGDAGLIHFKDENGDDRADGPPDVLLKIKTGGEHHAHAIRRGPDGWWYLIAGNYSEVTKGYVTEGASPIKNPHGGLILRLKPDASGAEIIADCFRNPYDFDFNQHGELFTYDSDGERDISLPWYLPTRLFHVVPGGVHGWISENCKHPDYFLDAAPVVATTGRGSPAGMVCYRHTQFPENYRGGLFILDWTFGRVLHVPLAQQGATYATQPAREFISTRGQMGFAPTDIEVGMDGSLFLCVGGRGTHGSVYRVKYTGSRSDIFKNRLLTATEVDTADQRLAACLEAPQPTSSWSRSHWVPLATKLGAQTFLTAALDEAQPTAARIRAIEILTDLFTGLPGTAAEILALAKAPELRARAVWSLGVRPPQGLSAAVLIQFLNDGDAMVRRRALEAAARLPAQAAKLLPAIAKCTNDEDRLVRMAAARILPDLKPEQFKQVADMARKLSWRAALTTTLGYIWRTQAAEQPYNSYAVDIGRRILEGKHSFELKLEAARVLQIAIGDIGADSQVGPAFEGYSASEDLGPHERDLDPLRIALARLFPTENRPLDLELGRLAAMITPANDDLLDKIVSKITADSDPVDDIHYLIVAARLPATPGVDQREKIGAGLLNLERKLASREMQKDANWNVRLGEIYTSLATRDPALPGRIIGDPLFGRPGHVIFMSRLNEKQMPQAVAAFLRAVKADPEYPWNNDVVFVVGFGKTPEHYDLVRKQFEKFELRMAALMVLAESPQEQDRERFAAGLDSVPIEILSTCTAALEKLPAAKNAVELTALVKTMRRLGDEKNEFALRERIVKLLERNSGEKLGFVFGPAGYKPQPEPVAKWTNWVTQHYPEEAARQLGGNEADLAGLKDRLDAVAWDAGDIERGRKLYVSRGCAQCHGAGSGLGPDLLGVTSRFSREDLFIAIALPSRDVSPRYQTTLVETKSGKVYTGMQAYESADVRVLRNSVNQTYRIETRDIESERKLTKSLMPEGLMKDLKDDDLSDLYAYLKSLSARTAELNKPAAKETTTE